MKKYDNYKDSGIEWIGEIPEHWDRIRIKSLVAIKVTDGPHETPQWIENGVPFISAEAIKGNKIDLDFKRGYISTEQHLEYCKKSKVLKNDILFCKSGSTTGKSALVDTDVDFGIWSPLAIIRADKNKIDYKYLFQSIQSSLFQNQVETAWTFGTQPNIGMGALENLWIAIPTLEEQQSIANYLDHKTTQIDTLIAKKEQFISLLQEERTAVINQAVTKGLDPKVKMKDSGIEWLGEIPEHWEVKKLKYLLKENKDSLKTGPFGSHIKNSDYIPNGNYKVYTQRNVLDNEYENGCESISEEKFDELKGFTIYEGDVLITTRGSIGRCSVFPENMPTGILHPCLIRIQINENLSLRNWIVNYINNTSLFYNNVKFNSNSTIIDVIYGYTLKEIFFPTPSIIEQKKILEFLEVKINEIDTLISKSQQEIELLKEYKTALISEVVTGKIDVRDVILN